MIKYPSGKNIEIGDRVWYEEGMAIGYIAEINLCAYLSSSDDKSFPSVFINTFPVPSIIERYSEWPVNCFSDEGIEPLSRAENKYIDDILHAGSAQIPGFIRDLAFIFVEDQSSEKASQEFHEVSNLRLAAYDQTGAVMGVFSVVQEGDSCIFARL